MKKSDLRKNMLPMLLFRHGNITDEPYIQKIKSIKGMVKASTQANLSKTYIATGTSEQNS